MKYFDVTLPIREGMPVWPNNPEVVLHRIEKIEEGANSNVSYLGMAVHSGTHVDAPFHFLQTGKTVEGLLLEILIGQVLVVELDDGIDEITQEVVESLQIVDGTKRILFKTRNSRYWAEKRPDFQRDFVGIDEGGSRALVEKGVKLVGIDYLSISPFKRSRPTHEVMLNAGMVIIEGLDLTGIVPGTYKLICLPLKLQDADGAPARVVLIQE